MTPPAEGVRLLPSLLERIIMVRIYYEVQIECYNTKGEVYFSENYRYSKRQAAVQKVHALKRRHPSSEILLLKKEWKPRSLNASVSEAAGPEPTETSMCLISAMHSAH